MTARVIRVISVINVVPSLDWTPIIM